jgi:hypothetical protein
LYAAWRRGGGRFDWRQLDRPGLLACCPAELRLDESMDPWDILLRIGQTPPARDMLPPHVMVVFTAYVRLRARV